MSPLIPGGDSSVIIKRIRRCAMDVTRRTMGATAGSERARRFALPSQPPPPGRRRASGNFHHRRPPRGERRNGRGRRCWLFARAVAGSAGRDRARIRPAQGSAIVVRHENDISPELTDVGERPEFATCHKTRKIIDGQKITGWFTRMDSTLAGDTRPSAPRAHATPSARQRQVRRPGGYRRPYQAVIDLAKARSARLEHRSAPIRR